MDDDHIHTDIKLIVRLWFMHWKRVNGSYEALVGGSANDALIDFTGGIGERYTLSEAPSDLFNIMKKAVGRGYLLSASISVRCIEISYKSNTRTMSFLNTK